MTIHIDKPDQYLQAIFKKAFPEYNGKKWKITPKESVDVTYGNYSSGGTRYDYVLLNINNDEMLEVPTQHPYFDRQITGADNVPLGNGVICVIHKHFCGKDMGLELLLHPNDMTKYLPPPVDLDANEVWLLRATQSWISSYRKERVQAYFNNDQSVIETVKQSLITKGLLNKAGAITPAGRNALEALPKETLI